MGDMEESGSAFQARCQASMANSMLPREIFGSAVRSLRRVQSWEQIALIMMKEPKWEYRMPSGGLVKSCWSETL